MGFLRDLQQTETKAGIFGDARDMGRRLWRNTFGSPKENPAHLANFPAVRPKYKTNVSGAASFKRLIEAMRSFAPGGWSDDRIEESRQWTGAQYVAGHRKAEQMSLCEFQVFHKDPKHPDGKRPVERDETTPDHDGPYDLVKLLEKPNSQDTFGDLAYIYSQQMDLTGMALTWMVPNENGTPMELYNLPTAIAIPQPAINPDYPDGYYRIQPLYPYGPFSSYPTPASAVGAPVPAEWIIRMKFPHPILRYDGFSPYTGLRLQIDTVTQMDRSRWYTLKRLLSPWAVLDMTDVEGIDGFPEEEIERIRADFENEHQGTENVGKLLVPFPGAKLNPWNTNLKDLEYAQGWEQILSFVLAGLGVTKPVAGMMEQTAYAAFFASLKQFHLLTLKPQCVSGETPLITRDGAGPIAEYADKEVEVWNGKRWSKVTVKKTGENRTLMRVRFSDGSHLDCTPDHRFSVSTRDIRRHAGEGVWREVMAKDLRPRMGTETFSIQHDGGREYEDAYTLGVLLGDGRVKQGIAIANLFGPKMKLPVAGDVSGVKWQSGCKVPYVHLRCGKRFSNHLLGLRANDEAVWWDMFSLDRQSILQFVAGWLDTDGSQMENGTVSLHLSGKFRADMVQLLLTKCGIRSTVGLGKRAGHRTNYGVRSADLWHVNIADCSDIPCYRLDVSGGHKPPCRGKYQTIVSVEYLPGSHDTYCFTEPEEGKGVFNNTLTFQCHRIAAGLTRRLAPFFGKDLIIEIRTERIDDHEILNGAINLAMQAKCITKNEIRKLLAKTLDLEPTREDWGEEIAGTEEQQQQPGMPGMPGAGGAMPGGAMGAAPGQGGAAVPGAGNSSPPAAPAPNPQAADPLDQILGLTPAKEEGPEAAGKPPTPGTLDQGSLGPRKDLLSSLRSRYKAAKRPTS